jgi:release factor glutamine methyltransferase
VHRRVAAGAPAWLAPGGSLLIETGRSQAERTAAAVAGAGLEPSVVSSDEAMCTVVIGTSASEVRRVVSGGTST